MEPARETVERHYGRGGSFDAILHALRAEGKDPASLTPADLAPVDEFHTRQRAGTVELAARTTWQPGLLVVDVGCGLGGSARYLAAEHGCRVTGPDLTREWIDAAEALTKLVGLEHAVAFHHGDALDMPFGDGGPPRYPAFWSEDGSTSFLATPEQARAALEEAGFAVRDWDDVSRASLDESVAALEAVGPAGPPPLGPHLLTGETGEAKFHNSIRDLREGRIVVIQALADKSGRHGLV